MKKITFLGTLAIMGTWMACTPEVTTDPNADLKKQVISNYADIVYASYSDCYDKAVALQNSINTFTATPSQVNFDAAKTAWEGILSPYSQTEAYRYYDGPIDDSDGPEAEINAWPMDENFIDYTLNTSGTGTVNSGIIFDTMGYPSITIAALKAANEAGGEKNISIGIHAIEFLLWGQDYIDVNTNAGQGGNRPYTDYTSSATHYMRRADYLKACAQLLVDNLNELKMEWAPTGSYRSYFKGLNVDVAIGKILTGIGVMSREEISGERMFTALEVNSADNPQEDELCCFSDKTLVCLIGNTQGVTNVLRGVYTDVNGTIVGNASQSIMELLGKISATKSSALDAINVTVGVKMNAIPTPFDKTVTEENVSDNGPTMQAILALQDQGDQIKVAASVLGISISTALPE